MNNGALRETLEGWAAARDLEGATFRPPIASPRVPILAEAPSDQCEALLLEHLSFIDRTIGAVARRHALSSWEADDFGGQVKLKLITDDYAVWRKFQGKSRLTTYLTTVIQNLFRDYRIRQWGKWRPSAAAKRLGDVGVQLEALLYRDRFSFSEAIAMLRNRFDCEATEHELLEIAGQIRPRTSRRFESDASIALLRAPDQGDQRVLDGEREAAMKRLETALRRVLGELEAEERLILKLRFVDGLTIRAIASTLDFDQRRIYARVRRLLRRLRDGMIEAGVTCGEVLDLLDWPACSIEAGLGAA